MIIDRQARRVFVDNKEIILTRSEWRALSYLYDNPHHIRSSHEIMNYVWGVDDINITIEPNSERSSAKKLIWSLRKKLGSNHILTRYGMGYLYAN